MAYNIPLSERIRNRLSALDELIEKEMMGGLVFMYNDKMCVGIIKDEMMLRIDPNLHNTLVEKTGCRTMDFTKKPMKGYILIDESGMQRDTDFNYWIELALNYNQFAKSSKKKRQ